MNIRASAQFSPGNFAKLESLIVPKIIAAEQKATAEVLTEALAIVPRDTGELASSGQTEVAWEGQQVTGSVTFTAPHAAYVEFGTGIRGAASPGAGPVDYSPTWPGMPAQPYLRPALDTAKPAIIDAYVEQGFKAA